MPATSTKKASVKRGSKRAPKPSAATAKIVRFVPRRLLEGAARAQPGDKGEKPGGGCIKCGSLYITIEPAFIHCKYCGNMSRIRGASLLAQEEWEMRSGMRLAS